MNESLVDRLRRLDTCAVSDALDRLSLPSAVTGIGPRSVRQRIAGRVRTVKLEAANGRTAKHHLCTTAIEASDAGDVIVIEQKSGIDAAGWGGILSIGAKTKGVSGVIVDGPARDIDEATDLAFPVYARSVTARTARGRIIEVSTGQPVSIGDVTVSDGDYVLADGSAVTFIPAAQIEKVVGEAEKLAAREGLMAKAAREGKPMSQVMGADYEQMLKG
ncbi:MAG TPA: RraA family protein [Stellaceae bacterium]|jgi:regulator of RNase E activity RraA|nr:RraA family protein [Stellaceae bacterium]